MSLVIKDRDNGYISLTKRLFDDRGAASSLRHTLEVGIFGEAGQQVYESGATVLEASIWAEFGTRLAPSRSWLRAWFDENRDLVLFWMRGEMGRVVDGKQTKEEALKQVGRRIVASIQARILARIPPPNAPSTEKEKGFNHPLIGMTGRLIKAISARVTAK